MRTVNIEIGKTPEWYCIVIGRRGETEATQVIFDITELVEAFGEGMASLMAKRPGDTDAYPIGIEQDGTTVTWTVSNADTSVKGTGECELFYYVGDTLSKTIVFQTVIGRDIGEVGEMPDRLESWVDSINKEVEGLSETVKSYNNYEITNPGAGEILIEGVS